MLPLLLLAAAPPLFLGGCGCGFDCNNGNNRDEPAIFTLGFSDSLPEELKQVVIEVDTITLRRSGGNDVVIDSFTIEELDLTGADTFQVNLLDYRGVNQLLVIDGLELDKGDYPELSIALIEGDINSSYVQEADDSLKAVTTASGVLDLPGMNISSSTEQYTVEFSLAQALQYQAGSDTYRLATDGIRVENTVTSARLTGSVDSDLFDSVPPCDQKSNPEAGNRLYLYQGTALSSETLADVFNDNSDTAVPPNALAPFAVASLAQSPLTGSWDYALGYLPAGAYTLVFACDTAEDDAVDYNALSIPLPTEQVYEITLSEAESATCNLGEGTGC